MLSIDQAATDYGVTVARAAEDGAFRVVGFVLSHEHMPAILLFKIQEPGGKGVPGLEIVVENGGKKIAFPTNESGYCDMAVGGGSWYYPARGESGPHRAWILLHGDSDVVSGLGMFRGTDHQSLITVWERTEGGDGMGDIEYDLGELSMYTHFRTARVEPRPGPGFHVTKLTAVGVPRKRDDKVLTVTFTKGGAPAEGVHVRVATYGRAGPGYITDEDGQVFFGMDEEWWYAVPGEPAKAIMPVAEGDLIGDTVVVGVVQGRWDWLNIEYRWSGDEELPGKPTFDGLAVRAKSFSVVAQCVEASVLGYTLDGPGYHWSGKVPLGDSGAVLTSNVLQPSTAYTLKAWGTNEAGDGLDAFIDFETPDEDEPPPPDCDDMVRAVLTILTEAVAQLEALLVEE